MTTDQALQQQSITPYVSLIGHGNGRLPVWVGNVKEKHLPLTLHHHWGDVSEWCDLHRSHTPFILLLALLKYSRCLFLFFSLLPLFDGAACEGQERGKTEGMTCSRGLWLGINPATVSRTQPLVQEDRLHQVSCWGAHSKCVLWSIVWVAYSVVCYIQSKCSVAAD